MQTIIRSSRSMAIAAASVLAAGILLVSAGTALASTGAVFTTSASCLGTNINIFGSKDDVYLDGGPHHVGSAGLPEGDYYVQVTTPNGTVLGTSVGSAHPTPAHVNSDGSFATCYKLSDILLKASNPSTSGYDDTTNSGGEYKVWVSSTSDFTHSTDKTDNFKVQDNTPPPPPQTAEISGTKFNDQNGNGLWDTNEPGLAGWTIELGSDSATTSATTDANGNFDFPNLAPGTYILCEDMQEHWAQTSPGTPTGPACYEVTLAGGDSQVLDFGNEQMGLWTVIKQVINDNGGTKVATDFTFHSTDGTTSVAVPVIATTSDPLWAEADVFVIPGTYTVTEDNANSDGYATSYSDCTGVVIAPGGDANCVVTNDDIAPVLTLNKQVINDNGGTATADQWTLTATGPTTISGTTGITSDATFKAGTYTFSEGSGPSGYATQGWTCTLNSLADTAVVSTITLGVGDVATCTVINNDIPPQLTLIKNVDNINGGTASTSAWTLTATGPSSISHAGAVSSDSTFQAGTYTLSESTGPQYYVAGNWNCNGDVANSSNSITLGIGQSATCTITNTYTPPTRTLGFWSTHTAYATSTFNSKFANGTRFYIGVDLPVGTNIHKGIASTTGELFGAYYSSIPYKADGKTKRAAIDQARMILLQQLVTAKLNCAAFGCSGAIQTLIGNADIAYAAGTSANTITSLANQLDAYNNSDDTVAIVGTTGNATQLASQALADKKFWDTP